MKKKIISLALVVAMVAIMLTSFTMAYFTDEDQNTNEFTVGNLGIDLYETVTFVDAAGNQKDMLMGPDGQETTIRNVEGVELGKGDDTNPNVQYKDITPGDKIGKIVTVENTKEYPAYVALAIKHEGYKAFNVNIDDYFEGQGYNAEQMQGVISDIFSGTGWNNLSYDKNTNGFKIRYYPKNVKPENQDGMNSYVGRTDKNAVLIAVDYTVQQGENNPGYSAGYMNNMLYETQFKDGNYMLSKNEEYNALNVDDRMWVYYLYLPAGASYTLDLSITCPTYITLDNIAAFDEMKIDVQAAAIQVDGFNNAKAAFKELCKTYKFDF